jgi:hypothetical protein
VAEREGDDALLDDQRDLLGREHRSEIRQLLLPTEASERSPQ